MILVDNNSLDGENLESLDRVIHPARGILYRIKNWIFGLLWPKDVYGINRPGNCLDDSHLYRSDCKACNRPIDPKLKEDIIKNVKPFWKGKGKWYY